MAGGASDAIVYALKYDGWPVTAGAIAVRMGHAGLRPWAGPSAVLVPVPLAARRERERGYNQSAVLASALARIWNVRAVSVVQRVRETPTQTRLTAEQRLHNVADAFAIDATRLARCAGARFVLVDDVVTTGATLNACAQALASTGAHDIGFITFGRARDPRAPPTP
jgi:ComF family protein